MSGATTYTTKAGNLWVYTLGASADMWVRQRDRHRPNSCTIGRRDLDALDAYDATHTIDPWFRLGEALGLEGLLALKHNEGASPGWMWRLYEDGVLVHLFASFEYADATVPQTRVLDGLDADALTAIIAAVETKPEAPNAAAMATPKSPALLALLAPIPTLDRVKALLDKQLDHMEATGDTFVRCDDARALRDLMAARKALL